MRETIFLSKEYKSKEEILVFIEELGVNKKYILINENTYNDNDIDIYIDNSFNEIMSFKVISAENFDRDKYSINNEEFYICMVIDHNSEIMSDLNILIKEILEEYSEMYVTDEEYLNFYNLSDIESEDAPSWLKI